MERTVPNKVWQLVQRFIDELWANFARNRHVAWVGDLGLPRIFHGEIGQCCQKTLAAKLEEMSPLVTLLTTPAAPEPAANRNRQSTLI